MSRTHYFFSRLREDELDLVVFHHRKEFEALLGDSFSEAELKGYERLLESMAPVYVEEKLQDLSFDDFYHDPENEEQQRAFFESSRSSLCFENMPFFEMNPFQVTYLQMLLSRVDQFLIDQGGVEELCFKETYLTELNRFKNMSSLVKLEAVAARRSGPSDMIDFLAIDVYKEINRLRAEDKLQVVMAAMSSRQQAIFQVMKKEELEPMAIQKKSGLIPKDFVDSLEGLKFFLKRQ